MTHPIIIIQEKINEVYKQFKCLGGATIIDDGSTYYSITIDEIIHQREAAELFTKLFNNDTFQFKKSQTLLEFNIIGTNKIQSVARTQLLFAFDITHG